MGHEKLCLSCPLKDFTGGAACILEGDVNQFTLTVTAAVAVAPFA